MTSPAELRDASRLPRRWGWWYVAESRFREMRAYVSYVVTSTFANPLMYLLALGVGLSRLVPQGLEGQPYLVFVAPALLMSTILTIGAEEGMFPVLGGFKWQKVFIAMHASPVSPGQIVGGFLTHLSIRFAFTATVYYLYLLVFGAVPLGTGWLMIPLSLLGAFAMLTPIAAYSAGIKDEKGQFALIQRFVVMPMFLFSGTFFPLSRIPEWLQWVGWASPLWHASQLGRAVSYGLAEPAWVVATHVGYLVLLATGGFLLMRRAFIKRLTR